MDAGTGRRVAVAGAAGDLGLRIAGALKRRGAAVVAIVKPGGAAARLDPIRRVGLEVAEVDLADAGALGDACRGAECVVSALNGLEQVMIDGQVQLLDAAVRAGVPRFISSDYSLDYTHTLPGDNRNLDLRRRFAAILDGAPIRGTSVLNGGFADLLAGGAPIVAPAIRRVLHFCDRDQRLDFTTRDDVADFTADAALDVEAPRRLRIAGASVSPADIAGIMTRITGRRYRTLRLGGLGTLGALIRTTRLVTPSSDAPFPIWQGLQYLRDMMSGRGKLLQLDNDRYDKVDWTDAREVLAAAHTPGN